MLGFVRVLYFCSSVLVFLSFIFRVFFCTTYMLKFFIHGYYCINVCFMFNKDQSINQSINQYPNHDAWCLDQNVRPTYTWKSKMIRSQREKTTWTLYCSWFFWIETRGVKHSVNSLSTTVSANILVKCIRRWSTTSSVLTCRCLAPTNCDLYDQQPTSKAAATFALHRPARTTSSATFQSPYGKIWPHQFSVYTDDHGQICTHVGQ